MIRDRAGASTRRPIRALVAGGVALLLLAPAPGLGQRIGLFFDPAGTICEAPIAYFDTVRVYVVGFPPVDSLLGGAFFSVEWPPYLEMWPSSFRMRREWVLDVGGDLSALSDLDVRFKNCVQSSVPLPLLEFVVWETTRPSPSDLRLRLIGGRVDSLVTTQQPAWKICDPADPERFTSLVTAPSVDAVFNCTRNCYCTTAVRNTTWTVVKSLYQGN